MQVLLPVIALFAYLWLASFSLHENVGYTKAQIHALNKLIMKTNHEKSMTHDNAVAMVCLYDDQGECK